MTACVESLSLGDGIEYFFRMWGCGFEPNETSMVVLLLSTCVLQAPSISISFLLFTNNTIYAIVIVFNNESLIILYMLLLYYIAITCSWIQWLISDLHACPKVSIVIGPMTKVHKQQTYN